RVRGVTVVLADLDSDQARTTASGLGAQFVPLDVTDRAANRAVARAGEAEHGRLDAVYLNAGIAGRPEGLLDVDDLLRVIAIDLRAVASAAAAALPALRRAGGGAVVVTASLAALSPMPGDPGYSVAKAGAVAF